jgi:hypothetical protein
MKEVVSKEQLNEVVLDPWRSKRALLVVCEDTKMFLGIEYYPSTGTQHEDANALVIFSKTPNCPMSIHEWERIEFYPATSKFEDETDTRPFVRLPGRRTMTRTEVMTYLQNLGFNPKIIDRIFPRQYTQMI